MPPVANLGGPKSSADWRWIGKHTNGVIRQARITAHLYVAENGGKKGSFMGREALTRRGFNLD